VLGPNGPLDLEALDAAGEDWFGDGPGGAAAGALDTVIAACSVAGTDPEWAAAVAGAIHRAFTAGEARPMLVVKRGGGWMFHASRAANRESIARHGLDWRRMARPGIAGNDEPEGAGVFLCADLESARWFASMPRPGPADIWRVRVDGLWLESDPNASGGADDAWMIAAQPISAEDVALCQRDVGPRSAPGS